MPQTALTFLVGSVAISGLPPLNGFASEWLIYLGAFRGAAAFPRAGAIGAVCVLVSLALVGGLAAACFVKAWGTVFLGEPRSPEASRAHEAPRSMRVAMWTGAALCVAIGLGAVGALRLVAPAAAALAGLPAAPVGAEGPLGAVGNVAALLVVLALALVGLRALLLRGREVGEAPTWGCGYAAPTARMQYTAASFAEPTLAPFSALFHRSSHGAAPVGLFPKTAKSEEHWEDRAHRALTACVRRAVALMARLEFLQNGRVQLYLAYVLATLVVLLGWQAIVGGP
jgi:NADH:ubiquinone oxidoreductase subunit 5 (subunit L)/multisubunit Na+/H+ antiporter MnhA subunit